MATASTSLARESKNEAAAADWISVTQAARKLQRSRTSIYHYIESGLLRAHRIGERGWRTVASNDVQKILASREEGSRHAAR